MASKPPRLLTIRRLNGEPDLEFSFLEWKDDERDEAYLFGPSGESLVLKIVRPTTWGISWMDPIIPSSIPVLIEPIRLMPPPTRMNAQEASLLKDFGKTAKAAKATNWYEAVAEYLAGAWKHGLRSVQQPEPWEARYGECLAPPDDPSELSEVLERITKRAEAEYEQRRIEESTWTKEQASAWLFGSDCARQATEEEYREFLANRQEELRKVFAWHPMSMPGLFKDLGGEMTKFLHVRWARDVGVDLRRMARERKSFLNRVTHIAVLLDQAGPFKTQKQLPWLPKCLDDLTASVRLRITMANGDITWASNLSVTDPIDSGERENHSKALSAHPECQTMTQGEVLEWLDQQIPRGVPRGDRAWKNYCKRIKHPPREPLPRNRLPEIFRIAEDRQGRRAVAKANAERAKKRRGESLQEPPSAHRVLI